MLAHSATKKWYVASSKYTLLEVDVQLMVERKNLPDVESVHLHICLPLIARLWRNTSSKKLDANSLTELNIFATHLLNASGVLLRPCGITNHS